MSTNKTVIVLTPNGRRQNVKVTLNTTILQILEEVCNKHKLNPNEYEIKHHNNILDTTTLIQFSGLPNNAQLELSKATKIRQESEATIGMQLETGERLLGNFLPNITLWEVIAKLTPNEIETENLVIIYMRNEIYGNEILKKTTLRSLGITGGRAMVRLVHRDPESLKVQANVSAPLPAKPSEEKPYKRIFVPATVEVSTKEDVVQPEIVEVEKKVKVEVGGKVENKVEPMEVDEKKVVKATSSDEDIVFLGERNAIAFKLEMAKSVPHDDLPDEYFDLTVNDAKKLLKDLRRRREEMETEPLQTKEFRELEKNKKVLRNLNQYKRSVIRIQFPDRTVLQGTFKPIETVQHIKDFVKEYLSDTNMEFDLFTTPPKEVVSAEARLAEADLVPSAILHFAPVRVLAETENYLRSDVFSKLSSYSAASLAATKSRGIVEKVSKDEDSSGTSTKTSFPSTSNKSHTNRAPPSNNNTKMPKWFKP